MRKYALDFMARVIVCLTRIASVRVREVSLCIEVFNKSIMLAMASALFYARLKQSFASDHARCNQKLIKPIQDECHE